MSVTKSIKTYPLLRPFSFLYGIGAQARNLLFNWGILPIEKYPVAVICIGNLSVGGTGKTPHTEYLIRLLSEQYKIAVVSRGYKRKTKGFVLADEYSNSEEIGDEPFQMKRKFPFLTLAVDSNRRRAIKKLLNSPEAQRPEVILLDDALQHRYVLPTLTILLTDYNRPYYQDCLLPAGRLREPVKESARADIIITTKCTPTLADTEYKAIESALRLKSHQIAFFTNIIYGDLIPVFEGSFAKKLSLKDIRKEDEIVLVSGIAAPGPLIKEITSYTEHVSVMNFPDHHLFKNKDIKRIKNEFDKLTSPGKIIIVTEKDAMRLTDNPFIDNKWKSYFYYLPITIRFCREQENRFKEIIINHIHTIKQNTILR